MVWQFAEKELIDSRDRFENGSYSAAAQFLQNSNADLEESPYDFGKISDEYAEKCDEFKQVVEAGHPPDEEKLDRLLDRLERLMTEMKDRVE
jgi:hypothetical protein